MYSISTQKHDVAQVGSSLGQTLCVTTVYRFWVEPSIYPVVLTCRTLEAPCASTQSLYIDFLKYIQKNTGGEAKEAAPDRKI